MLFLTPSQQYESTEGSIKLIPLSSVHWLKLAVFSEHGMAWIGCCLCNIGEWTHDNFHYWVCPPKQHWEILAVSFMKLCCSSGTWRRAPCKSVCCCTFYRLVLVSSAFAFVVVKFHIQHDHCWPSLIRCFVMGRFFVWFCGLIGSKLIS